MGKIVLYVLFGLIGSFNLLYYTSFETFNSSTQKYSIVYSVDINDVDFLHSNFIDTTSTDSVKSCTDCHADLMQKEEKHSPAKKDCNRCHVSNNTEHPLDNSIGFELKNSVPDLCYECHDPKNVEEFVHEPAGKGDCLLCHDIHSSDNLYLAKSNPISGLCYECHDLKIPENNLVHGAVSDGNCTGCHNPHQANNKSFIANTKLDRLCKKCHKSIKKELKKEHVHDPFKKKNCFDCHNAHSSKEAHLSDLKTKELCLSCHDDIHTQVNDAKLVHGAINEVESCLNCHSPHASDHGKNLKLDNVATCLTCHNEEIKTDSSQIEAIGPHLLEGNTVHGAITEEGCSTCHNAHVSEEHSLLKEPFPEERYVKSVENDFNLCFRCHSKDIILVQVSATVTNFRDGEENLHFRHINKGKGRNCNICHDVHGTENKFMIKKSTAFGKWDMPMNYEPSLKGGTCRTGCHDERKYDREYAMYQY